MTRDVNDFGTVKLSWYKWIVSQTRMPQTRTVQKWRADAIIAIKRAIMHALGLAFRDVTQFPLEPGLLLVTSRQFAISLML